MIKYELIIYWSQEDESFIVEVPELSGCMADGATYQEALANAETVIREWVDTARELGRPVPEPKGRLVYA
jgi:predicted RNase H-like HicB family nuclease